MRKAGSFHTGWGTVMMILVTTGNSEPAFPDLGGSKDAPALGGGLAWPWNPWPQGAGSGAGEGPDGRSPPSLCQLPRARGLLEEHLHPNEDEEGIKEACEPPCGGPACCPRGNWPLRGSRVRLGGGSGMTYCATWAVPSGAPALCLTQVPWQAVTWARPPQERSRCL